MCVCLCVYVWWAHVCRHPFQDVLQVAYKVNFYKIAYNDIRSEERKKIKMEVTRDRT